MTQAFTFASLALADIQRRRDIIKQFTVDEDIEGVETPNLGTKDVPFMFEALDSIRKRREEALDREPEMDEQVKDKTQDLVRGVGLTAAGIVEGLGIAKEAFSNAVSETVENLQKGPRIRGIAEAQEPKKKRVIDPDARELALFNVAARMREAVNKYAPGDERLKEDFMSKVAEGLGSTVALGATFGAGPAAGAIAAGSVSAADLFTRAKEGGANDEDALISAGYGIPLGLLDLFPIANVFKRLNRASGGRISSKIAEVIKAGVVGSVEEGVQEFVQSEGANAVLRSVGVEERGLMEDSLEAGKVGGFVGLLMNSVARTLGFRSRYRVAETEITREQAETLSAKESPSRTDFEKAGLKELIRSGGPAVKAEQREAIAQSLREQIQESDRAGEIRKDEGVVQEAGVLGQEGEGAGGPDVQQVQEAGRPAVTPREEGIEIEAEERRPVSPMERAGIAIDLEGIPALVRKGLRYSAALVRKYLRPRGELTKDMFAEKVKKNAAIEANTLAMSYTLKDFDRAAKEAYGGRKEMTPRQRIELDLVLKGKLPSSRIPEAMRSVISDMRQHIDSLSSALIDIGAVEGNLAATVADNFGIYATRSYRVFDDPDWSLSVPEDVRNKAKAFIRQSFPDLSEAEVEGEIAALLYEGTAAETPIALLKRTRLGSKDLSILKHRKDIPPEIRALWGEYKDARVNYARSVFKMGHLIANHKFLKQIREDGLGTVFFEAPVVNESGEFKTRIAADQSSVMYPLNGLWTTPEIKNAFESMASPAAVSKFLAAYMKLNGFVKYAKTVLSLQTHIRNLLGNQGFAIANGHWRLWKAGNAIRATINSVVSKNKEWNDYYLRLARLGVVSDNASAGELKEVLREAGMSSDLSLFLDNSVKAKIGKAGKFATELYRAEDDVWKIYGFENERARYKNAIPELSDADLDQLAANIVRDTYPTYSMAPEAVKLLRRFPFVGPFVTFFAETIRVTGNTAVMAERELADPRTRAIGAQRLVGLTMAAGALDALAHGLMYMLGVTPDEDRDLRHFLAPWMQNSALAHIGKSGDASYRVIDVGYSDPHAILKDPVRRLWSGKGGLKKSVIDSVVELGRPFFSEEILMKAIREIASNKKDSGAPVYNEEDNFNGISRDISIHLAKAFEPGTLTSFRRIARGMTGYVTPYGKAYNPTVEAIASFTGQRINDVDVRQSLQFRLGDIQERLGRASQIASIVANRRGTITKEEFVDAYARSEQARAAIIAEGKQVVEAAMRLGVPKADVDKIIDDRRISGEVAYQIMTGDVLEHSLLSNRLYSATNPKASDIDKQRAVRELAWLEMPAEQARALLRREVGWRSRARRPDGTPVPPSSRAYWDRVRRLSILLQSPQP